MSDRSEDPWRFYNVEHLWNRLMKSLEQKEVVEQKLYLYEQLVSYYMQRDIMMSKIALAETDSIKESILDNIAIINDQIEGLIFHLEIKREDDYERIF